MVKELKLMQTLAQKITSYFIAKDIIEKSKKELCEYVIYTKFLFILTMSVIMLISVMCNSVFETIVYLLVVLKLRKHLGGYHANSEIGCFCLSVVSTIIVVNLIIPKCMELDSIIILGFILLCTIIMWNMSTINHPNMNMTDEEINANTNILKKVLVGLMIIVVISYIIGNDIVIVSIAIGEIVVLVLALISKILGQEVNKNGIKKDNSKNSENYYK